MKFTSANPFKTVLYALTCLVISIWNLQANAAEIPLSPELQKLFPHASHIHQEDRDLSIIPVYRFGEVEGYAFRTAELFPVRGYGGKPIDILIGLSPKGHYTGFVVLNHYEPIFVKGDGPQILTRYMEQLINVPASNNIYIRGDNQKTLKGSGKSSYIDGITNATVTTSAINQTITKAARAAARAKELAGYAPLNRSIPRTDKFSPMSFQKLLDEGLIKHWPIYDQQIKTARQDKKLGYPSQPVAIESSEPIAELFFVYLSHPVLARNLLPQPEYALWQESTNNKDQYLLVLSKGNWNDEKLTNFLSIKQRGTEVIRHPESWTAIVNSLNLPNKNWDEKLLLRLPQVSAFDPITRTELFFTASTKAKLKEIYQLPTEYFELIDSPELSEKTLWQQIWQQRQDEIALVLLGLTVLTIIFLNQHYFVQQPNVFHKIRWSYLGFTLLFIGVYAQGQLSIVNVLTFQHLLLDGSSTALFLLDPIIFILGCYVLLSLILFGRGLFCGWLCPFGALQEFMGLISKKLSIPQWKIKPQRHRQLQKIKYLALAVILVASFFSLTYGEVLAELEPFKTSVTLYFIREWHYVVYALLLLVLALKIHKFYCRYLCPLGACFALLGSLPIFNWLTRRAECGSPCQNCRMNCEIDAINKQGVINMRECVQCLECIVINSNPSLCAIEVAETKKQKRKASYIEVTPYE